MKKEIERRESTGNERLTCRGCGKPVILYFNGGELDYFKCCDFFYETVHARIDLVISKEE